MRCRPALIHYQRSILSTPANLLLTALVLRRAGVRKRWVSVFTMPNSGRSFDAIPARPSKLLAHLINFSKNVFQLAA